jgi:hypothetical protein
MVSQIWARGHVESWGTGVTVLDWLRDVIFKVENEKSSLDCVRDDEQLADASG